MDDDELFKKIERIMAQFIMSIAKVINWLIGKIVGKQITLDDIIFNKFPEIRLDFFKTDIFGNAVTSESSLVMDLRSPVTLMYNFFRNLVLIGYMIILVYIGLKLMLESTTAKKKATYKETFMYWVTGIVILFFMPYYMKYVIALNDAIVTYISDDSGIRSEKSRDGELNASQMNESVNKGFLKTDFENIINYNGKDYMSSIGTLADNYHKLGFAIAFLILTWQIVTLLIYYYKRIFITALLIIIFPLIAFTYVWDKLNDGKSQALSAWTREFTITVFVQVFHAIVYVFITNTIYATIQGSTANGQINADFILLIIASSFLFVGEDILKRMFGSRGDEALGSATQSAVRVAAITTGTVGIGKRIIKNTVGRDGFVRKTARSVQEARTYGFLAKRPNGAGTPSRMEMIARDQEYHRGVGAYLPTEGEITPILNEAAEMLYGLNNSTTPREFANAYQQYHQLMDARNGVGVRKMTDYERNQFDQMMKRSNIDFSQLDRLDKAIEDATIEVSKVSGGIHASANKDKMKQITQELRMEIEAIFPATDREENPLTGSDNIMANKVMNASLISMAENGLLAGRKSRDISKVWQETIDKDRETASSIKIATNGEKGSNKTAREEAKARGEHIFEQYKNQFSGMSKEQQQKANDVSERVATLHQMFSGEASAFQLTNAMKFIDQDEERKEMAIIMLQMAGIDTDIDRLKYMLAKKIDAGGDWKDRRDPNKANWEKQANEAKEWARRTVVEMEAKAEKDAQAYRDGTLLTDDPVITIYDILEASEKGARLDGTNRINNINEMFYKSSIPDANDEVLDRKRDVINRLDRIRMQELSDVARDFGTFALEEEGYNNNPANTPTGEVLMDGFTRDDMRKLAVGSALSAGTGVLQMATDVLVTPITTMAGFAIGAAVTDDFMPAEEAILGGIGGNKTSEEATKMVAKLSSEKERQDKLNEIKEKAGIRVKEKDREIANTRQAFEQATLEAKDGMDGTLVFKGANATMHIESDGTISATINVMAENAAFMSISEEAPIPSSGWEAYQESAYYQFSDRSPVTPHTLYIYVRDRSGNILGKRISGIHL